MSTEAQLSGDSFRRQDDSSKAYASVHGWELLEEDQLKDLGLSAFSGANVSDGALGQFLQAVRDGKVQRGSILIIESLDRLSRQKPSKALGLFSEIINSGVDIVTLSDGRTYTTETDLGDLIFSLVDMSRAHEESRTKSYRLGASWSNKRKNIGTRKLTAQCPGWLSLAADKKDFRVIQDRADVVIRIFEDSAAGIGNYSIAKRLNKNHISPFGRSNGWQLSYVAKILGSRAVLGEFQPHRLVDGKRVAEGDPISDYFPRIVPDQLFYRAQNARSQRQIGGGGRKGLGISNLFSGLARCLYCRSRMVFVDKGPKPKGGTYLVCDSARRGLGCEKAGWRYDHFEASFLAFVEELDLASLVRTEAEDQWRYQLDDEIESIDGKLASVAQEMERALDIGTKAGLASDFVGERLNALARERLELRGSAEEKRRRRTEFTSEVSGFYESKEQIKALLARLQQPDDSEVYKLRSQISSRLKSLVADLVLAPLGFVPSLRTAIEWSETHDEEPPAHLTQRLEDERERLPFLWFHLRTGVASAPFTLSAMIPWRSRNA